MNFLQETKSAISWSGHSIKDITFIGSTDSGYECTWEQFRVLADVDYDCGFGSAYVANDLVIKFGDGSIIWRDQYDGSESWEQAPSVRHVLAPKSITKLVSNVFGGSIEDIEKEND